MKSGLIGVCAAAALCSQFVAADFEIVTLTPLARASSSLFTMGGSNSLMDSSSTGAFPSYSGYATAAQTIGASDIVSAADFSLFLTTSQVITNGFANSGVTGGAGILSGDATADSDIEIVFTLDGPHHYIIHSVESQSLNAEGAVVLLEEETEIFRYEHKHVHEIVGNLDAGTYTLRLTADTTSDWAAGGALSVALYDLEFEIVEGSACAGDLNNDGAVDDSDFVLFAAAYDQLTCTPTLASTLRHGGCFADFNGDAVVDDADFVIFAAAYNALVCP